jgi:hypothetical protein
MNMQLALLLLASVANALSKETYEYDEACRAARVRAHDRALARVAASQAAAQEKSEAADTDIQHLGDSAPSESPVEDVRANALQPKLISRQPSGEFNGAAVGAARADALEEDPELLQDYQKAYENLLRARDKRMAVAAAREKAKVLEADGHHLVDSAPNASPEKVAEQAQKVAQDAAEALKAAKASPEARAEIIESLREEVAEAEHQIQEQPAASLASAYQLILPAIMLGLLQVFGE